MINSRPAATVADSSSFLTGLEQADTEAILAAAHVRRVSAKQNIATGGRQATHFFLIRSGRVHYYHLTKKGESVLLAWLGPGDVIGLVALLKSPSAYMATAEATSDCELLAWDRSVIRQLVSAILCSEKMAYTSPLPTCEPTSNAISGWSPRLQRSDWQRPYSNSVTSQARSIPTESKFAPPTINSEPWLISARLPPAVC